MLYGKTEEEGLAILNAWQEAIEAGDYYAFGFSKFLYCYAPPQCRQDPHFAFKAIFDNDQALHNLTLLGHKILPPSQIQGLRGKIVILSAAYQAITRQLKNMGLEENRDFIRWNVFWSLFCFFRHQKLHFPFHLGLSLTDRCSLRCQHCIIGLPYLKKHLDAPLSAIKNSLDLFFTKTDSLMGLSLIGGEPLLYPELAELIEYIGRHYRYRIIDIALVTNGMLNLPNDLLNLFKQYDLRVVISDYSEAGIAGYNSKINRLITTLSRDAVSSETTCLPWWDPHPTSEERQKLARLNDDELKRHYQACAPDCPFLLDSFIYPCAMPQAIKKTGVAISTESDEERSRHAVDLRQWNPSDPAHRRQLLMHFLGYFDGVPDSCRLCIGRATETTRMVPRARQLT